MTANQQTIQKPITFKGISLHSGQATTINLLPAPPDFGIHFRRVDIDNCPYISASVCNVSDTKRCTVIQKNGIAISTVEHLMSALSGLQIDNAVIEVGGDEIPICDGSAKEFCDLIMQAGIIELTQPRKIYEIEEPIVVTSGTCYAIAVPYDGFKISVTITNDHKHPALTDQFFECEISPQTYFHEICPARTFGFMHEAKMLQNLGLIKGVNENNTVILDDEKIITPLRFANELVRHKALDLIGDLSFLGSIKAHIIAVRPSHYINNQLARAITEKMRVKTQ